MAEKMAPAEGAAEAEQHWLEAKKIIHSMVKKLEQISKDESGSKKLLAELESVEHLLESLRLACMATAFTDFKFAHKNRVLDRLWHVHTLISAEYKKGLQRHRGHGQIVQFRTVEKQYAKHLKTAQYFYKGFIERLSARYRLQSLQRVAHTMQSGSIRMDEVIDAREARLSQELTVACYRTVLHMGDIARYRLNASRQKSHSPDVAMTYYALAQDLMPHEGDAHHQMAVVLAEQRHDFDVVYHFFRSWSVQQPFALAPKNLASEFKKLLQPPSASRKQANTPPDPYEMFGSWFVRLHANYFRGEEFSSQKELEREVLHRWEALLKRSEKPAYLLKAVLMNVAAYDIAQKRLKNEWTAAGSQSCQFILRFMVHTILALSRVLETEIQRLFEAPSSEEEAAPEPKPKAAPASSASEKNPKSSGRSRANNGSRKAADDKRAGKKNTPSDTCLSLFRICMAWIAKHHEDLVTFKDHLSPDIADMHRSITHCLTLFIELVSTTSTLPVPYLLPEDVEVIGLAPLDDWAALHEGGANTPFKPHFDEEGVERKEAAHETLARIYDIVECTVHLIGDPSFPWVLEPLEENGRDVSKIVYAEDHVPPSLTSANASATPAIPGVSASYAAPTAPAAACQLPAAVRPTKPSGGGKDSRQPSQRQTGIAEAAPAQAAAAVADAHPGGLPISGLGGTRRTSQLQSSSQSMSYKDMDDDDDFLPGSAKKQPLLPVTSTDYTSSARADQELDLLESAAYSRVENFLSPPELHPHFPPAAPSLLSSSSYGMHTATAEDIFGQLQTPAVSGVPIPGAASAARPIPSSPWNSNSYSSSLGYYPHAAPFGAGSMESSHPGPSPQPARQPTNIEEQLAFLTLAKQHERQFAAAAAAPPMPSYGMDSSSRGFPSALSPVGAAKQPHSPSDGIGGSGPGGFVNPWAAEGTGGFGSLQNNLPLIPQHRQQSQAASFGIGSGMGMTSQAGTGSSPAMLYSSNFTPSNNPLSSLPPVQSPRGLPEPQWAQPMSPSQSLGGGTFERTSQPMRVGGATATASPQKVFPDMYESIYGPQANISPQQQQQQQQQQQHHQQYQFHNSLQRGQRPVPGSSSVFGGPFGGFGNYSAGVTSRGNEVGGVDAPVDGLGAPGAAAASVLKWQDAATAWGRGTPLAKDDPTHFRNAVRQTGLMEDTNAYDRNALMSALRDDSRPTGQR